MLARSARIRKRVTLYTTAPYLNDLGTTVDPCQRLVVVVCCKHVCVCNLLFWSTGCQRALGSLEVHLQLETGPSLQRQKGSVKNQRGATSHPIGCVPDQLGTEGWDWFFFSVAPVSQLLCLTISQDVLCLVGGILTECLRVTWRTWANWMNICRPQ